MTDIHERIIRALDASETPMLMPAIARTIGADEGATSKSLRSLRKAKRVHQVGTGSGAWRLTNGERCALAEEAKRAARIRAKKRRDDLPDPPEAPPKVPRDGLPEPAIGDLQPDHASAEWDCTVADGLDLDEQTPAATTATDQIAADQSSAPELATDGDTTDCSDKLTAERSGPQPAPGDTEVSAAGGGIVGSPVCENPEAIGDQDATPIVQLPPDFAADLVASWQCKLVDVPEPTDAELDAIKAEEDQNEELMCCDVEAAGTGKFPPAIGLVPAEPENSGTPLSDEPQHSKDCGTKYRGCAPDCEFDRVVNRCVALRASTTATEPTCSDVEAVEEPSTAPSHSEPENSAEAGAEMRDHVWGPARPKPTKGLRIEQVVKEFVALEARRKELLEELRGLVG